VESELKKNGFRVASDLRNEKITYKIREHSLQKLPYLLVTGEREMQNGQVAVRTRKGEDLGAMQLSAFIEMLRQQVDTKGSAA
jgi:threonyl-tRNA synthetase